MDRESNIIRTTIVRDALNARPSREFRPVAYWRDDLDTIEVVTKPASFREVGSPWESPLVLHVGNYPKDEGTTEYVGFEISCATVLCLSYSLIHNRRVSLRRLLDALAESFQGHDKDFGVARQLVHEHNLDTVEISDP